MNALTSILALMVTDAISATETTIIDEALAKAKPSDIPLDQTKNVIDYINAEILYNHKSIPEDQKTDLETLSRELARRNWEIKSSSSLLQLVYKN